MYSKFILTELFICSYLYQRKLRKIKTKFEKSFKINHYFMHKVLKKVPKQNPEATFVLSRTPPGK